MATTLQLCGKIAHARTLGPNLQPGHKTEPSRWDKGRIIKHFGSRELGPGVLQRRPPLVDGMSSMAREDFLGFLVGDEPSVTADALIDFTLRGPILLESSTGSQLGPPTLWFAVA